MNRSCQHTRVEEEGLSLETVMKRGALVCVVAMGGVAVGLAIWALRRWHDEREYQAWRASVSADPVPPRSQRLPGRRPARLLPLAVARLHVAPLLSRVGIAPARIRHLPTAMTLTEA